MKKPKGFTPVKLRIEQPDCCFDCPLCGVIPKGYVGRPKGSKKTHVCLGTMEALSGRGITITASSKQHDPHHKLKRPCDTKWEAWIKLEDQYFMMPDEAYLQFRLPFEQKLQMKIKF